LEPAQQILLANKIVMEKLSVREAERLVQRQSESPANQAAKKKIGPDRDTLRIQEEVSAKLGTTVEIKSGKKGTGKLIIEYSSNDQLSDLLNQLTKGR
jgi:ParB family chromosome partitioning protein